MTDTDTYPGVDQDEDQKRKDQGYPMPDPVPQSVSPVDLQSIAIQQPPTMGDGSAPQSVSPTDLQSIAIQQPPTMGDGSAPPVTPPSTMEREPGDTGLVKRGAAMAQTPVGAPPPAPPPKPIGPAPPWSQYAVKPPTTELGKLGHVMAGFFPATDKYFNVRPQQQAQQAFEAANLQHQQEITNQREAESQKSTAALQASEATKNKAQATASGNIQFTIPPEYGGGTANIPAGKTEDFLKALAQVQGRKDVGTAKNKTTEDVANINEKGKENTLNEKVREFNNTDDYRRWKENLDTDTRKRVSELSQSKAPATIMATAVYANGGLQMMSDAEGAMQRLEQKGVMGSVGKNKVEDWVFSKGLVDPSLDADTKHDIGVLRASLGYTSSAAMRAHTGRTSREIYDDFKQRLGADQDWSALRGPFQETRPFLTEYSQAASDASIGAIRHGEIPGNNGGNGNGTPPPGAKVIPLSDFLKGK